MKNDLDTLMAAQNLDAILVTGPAQHNPAMVYMTGGGHLTGADLIKKRGEEPILFCNPMERDEAAHTGLQTTQPRRLQYQRAAQSRRWRPDRRLRRRATR